MLSFTLAQWSMWVPQTETVSDFSSVEQMTDIVADLLDRATTPQVKDLPMMLRRRLSRFGRMAMRVAVDTQATDDVRLVFSSRFGDAAQTAGLLEDLSKQQPVSPAVFSMLVHNALAGVFCIHNKNRHPHTAIAAGQESFCAGLLEAGLMLEEDPSTPVLLLYCDEPLPEIYQGHGESTTPSVALALLLTKTAGDQQEYTFGFSVDSDPRAHNSDQKIGSVATLDEADPAVSFINFLSKKTPSWSWSSASKTWWCGADVG